ncbi:MAG: D-alanine--D-alanine ligase [Desulfobacterales bacterium]|nr:D-alanine--D-alanine ligase [Desulfobacterales bacterium]
MFVGLTYDLRSEYLAAGYGQEETAEFDKEETIAAIEAALVELGHDTERIGHARNLAGLLASGRRWDLVFNIAEGLNGVGREAQVPAMLDLYGIVYTFSDPLVMSLTLHKAMTKRVVRDAGIATPAFAEVSDEQDLAAVAFPPPYFVKPVAEGTGKGVSAKSIVKTRADLGAVCESVNLVFRQPALVEAFLTGREFTVGLIGTGKNARVLGTIEVNLLSDAEPGAYTYINKERYQELVEYRRIRAEEDAAVAAAEALALRAWRVLGCRDGGRIDIRCDEAGSPQFLEVNPLAGLNPIHSDLPIICSRIGMSYRELIGEILTSAAVRATAAQERLRSCA